MERLISGLRQRATSFNPEAAAFNPGLSSPTAPATADILHSTLSMAPMFNCSPFDGPGSFPSLHQKEPLTPALVRLEDFLSPDVQALVRKLEEHPGVQEVWAPPTPDPDQKSAQISEAVAEQVSNLPLFAYPNRQPQAACNTVDLNELSASLGLPTAKTETIDDVSPSASYKSRASQAHPGALYGKLIGWALEEPLTAKGLADFLQSQEVNVPMQPLAAEPLSPAGAESRQDSGNSSTRYGLRSNVESSTFARDCTGAPVPAGPVSRPKSQSTPQHQHRRSSASSGSYHHHSLVSSRKRHPPRRTSRAKRIDQGPLPSAADIYPDDAHWTPAAPIQEVHDYVSHHQRPVEQRQIIVTNPFNWPLPVQACRPEPAPTAADIDAADIDVLALMDELPEPSLDTLAKLGNSHDLRISTAFDLHCDKRVLTPAQEDGSRYGIRFYGLAYGDSWELPQVGDFEDSGAFRSQFVDHDGWGGRVWASSKA